MNQIRQLTHTAANALRGSPLLYGESFFVTFSLGGTSYLPPYGKCVAWTKYQPVDMGDSKSQISGFILLQLHIDITQTPSD